MGKVTAIEIKDLGFTYSQFNLQEAEFDTWLAGVIDEQAAILEVRIGSTIYASAAIPAATYVKRAEKCLVASELFQRRIVSIAGNAQPSGQEPVTESLDKQQKKYADEAQGIIDKLVAGAAADAANFASGVVVTSHFDEVAVDA